MAGYQGITAGYLIRSSRPCLVETGTSTSAPVVRAALATLGIEPADLATVVVTHIHLDHAGGVGDIASMFPSAEVVVHEKGARHLADPSRLMASARMVYGDALDVLFGELAPVPADRLRALDDVGAVDLGDGRRLESYYSPGHAKHHVGLLDSRSGDLYVGDAAGVYIPETGDLRPATPPPDFDLEVALASLGEVRRARPVAAAVLPLRAGVGRAGDAGALGGGDLRLGVGDAGGPFGGDGPGPRGRGGAAADAVAVRGAFGDAGRRTRRQGEVRADQRGCGQRRRDLALAGQARLGLGFGDRSTPAKPRHGVTRLCDAQLSSRLTLRRDLGSRIRA